MERRKLLALSGAALALVPLRSLHAQSTTHTFSSEQLDQLLAPIALYPDALLSQVLMAATYPLEVVEAARWSLANPNLKGDAAVTAVKDKSWDVSVKSLVAFPQTLQMMNNQLDWTQKLGNAMLSQQKDVAASVQRLRGRAEAAGTLKSTPQQKVTTQSSNGANAIVIEPASPEVVYVPYYNPAWAYGAWPYPAYPPPYYPPPPNYGAALMTGMMFGLGVAAGAAMFGGWHWGYSGGGWGNSYTTVNVNKATNISANNFDANKYRNGQWSHDAGHRGAVPYATPAEREKYNQHRNSTEQEKAFRNDLQGRGNYTTQRPENRSSGTRSYEGRNGEHSALDGVNRGEGANRDYQRGSQSWGNRSWGGDRGGGGGFHGGGGGRR